MRRLKPWPLAAIAVTLLTAGCNGDDIATTTTAPPTTASTTTTAAPTSTAATTTTEATTTTAVTTTTSVPPAADRCPTADSDVRKALAALIDREEISAVAFDGAVQPIFSPVPPSFPAATDAFLDLYQPPNADLADRLLRAAGYSEDSTLVLNFAWPPERYGTETGDAAQLIAAQWEASGLIEVNPIVMEWQSYVGPVVRGNAWPVSVLGWFFEFPDPENYLAPFIEFGGLGTSVTDADGNPASSIGRALFDLLAAQRAEPDPEVRKALLGQLQDVYADAVVTIPLFAEPEYVVYRDGISADPRLPVPERLNIGPTMELHYDLLDSADGDTITIGTTDPVFSLDGADAFAIRDWEIIRNIGDGLVGRVPGTADQLEPVLAEDFAVVSEDGLAYTYTLREGIRFSDGLELTNVMYAGQLNRLFTLSPDAPNAVGLTLAVPYVDSIEASGERDIVFTLTQPLAFFPQLLAGPAYTPTHPDIFTREALNILPSTPIHGVGPWFITEFVAREQMVFEPNPAYAGKAPQAARIVVRHFRSSQEMADAIRSGEIDVAWRILDLDLIEQLKIENALNVEFVSDAAVRFLIVNHAETCIG